LPEAIGLVAMPGLLIGPRGRFAFRHLGPYDLLDFRFAEVAPSGFGGAQARDSAREVGAARAGGGRRPGRDRGGIVDRGQGRAQRDAAIWSRPFSAAVSAAVSRCLTAPPSIAATIGPAGLSIGLVVVRVGGGWPACDRPGPQRRA